jgi:hypothetical protein
MLYNDRLDPKTATAEQIVNSFNLEYYDKEIEKTKERIFNVRTGKPEFSGIYSYNSGNVPSRSNNSNLRKIITRMQLNSGEHWIRFKNINATGDFNNFFFDYIELVPLNIISDPLKPEDRH